jgi:hypothetical protein
MNKYNELKVKSTRFIRSFFKAGVFVSVHKIRVHCSQEAGKLDALMEKRRRKNASKDHRFMPYRHNSFLILEASERMILGRSSRGGWTLDSQCLLLCCPSRTIVCNMHNLYYFLRIECRRPRWFSMFLISLAAFSVTTTLHMLADLFIYYSC